MFFAVIINIAFIPLFVSVLKLPFTILAPIIFVLCIVGGYAPTQDLHDVWLIVIFGVVFYLLRKLNYPVAPAVLAIVLGPLTERALRQSLISEQGDITTFVDRPLSAGILAIAVLLIVLPAIKMIRRKKQSSTVADASSD